MDIAPQHARQRQRGSEMAVKSAQQEPQGHRNSEGALSKQWQGWSVGCVTEARIVHLKTVDVQSL